MTNFEAMNSKMTSMSVNSFLTDLKSKNVKINLNPKFQRGVVWSNRQLSNYARAVLYGTAPQNLVMNYDKKEKAKTCIDGKQRSTSLLLYSNNEFPITIDDQDVYYNKLPEGADKENDRIMSDDEMQVFLNREIGIVEYQNLTYDQQRALFSELQNGTKLSRGEKVIALLYGENNANMMTEFCNKIEHNMKKFVKVDRKEHYQFVVDYMYMNLNNVLYDVSTKINNYFKEVGSNKKLKSSLDEISKQLEYSLTILNSTMIPKITKKLFMIVMYGMNQYYTKLKQHKNENVIKFIKNFLKKVKTLNIDMSDKTKNVYDELYKAFKAFYKSDMVEADDKLDSDSGSESGSDAGSGSEAESGSDAESEAESDPDSESESESDDEEIKIMPKKLKNKVKVL